MWLNAMLTEHSFAVGLGSRTFALHTFGLRKNVRVLNQVVIPNVKIFRSSERWMVQKCLAEGLLNYWAEAVCVCVCVSTHSRSTASVKSESVHRVPRPECSESVIWHIPAPFSCSNGQLKCSESHAKSAARIITKCRSTSRLSSSREFIVLKLKGRHGTLSPPPGPMWPTQLFDVFCLIKHVADVCLSAATE